MKNSWSKSKIETFLCPRCSRGEINFTKVDSHIYKETGESIEMHEYGSPPWSEELHAVIAKCQECEEPVCITYTKVINEDPDVYEYEQLSPAKQEDFLYRYCVKNIYPSPHLIKFPSSCSKLVQVELIKSFNLYWVDENACLNKIRVVLELLMDELKVKEGNLHERIKSLKSNYPELSEILQAVKLVGNIGSHETKIDNEDVLRAYELLEYSLEELYDPRQNKILKISRDLNDKHRKK